MSKKVKGSKINPNINFSKERYYYFLNRDNYLMQLVQRVTALESSPHFTGKEKMECIKDLMCEYNKREEEYKKSTLERENINAYVDYEIANDYELLSKMN